MKNTITVLLAALVLLIVNITFNVSNSTAQWQPDVRLTNAPDTSRTYTGNSRCMASNGSIVHTVWQDNRDGNMEIYCKRSTNSGVNWEQDTRLTNNPSRSTNPTVELSGSNVYVVWQDDRDGFWEIYYKRSTDAGISWGPETRLTVINTGAASFPSIVVSGLFVHVFWHDARNGSQQEIYYKRSTDGGNNWSSDIRLTNSAGYSWFPSCEVSGSVIHLAWQDNRDGNTEIYYKFSIDGGLTWDLDTRLTNDPASSTLPTITISGSNLHVVWCDNRDGNTEIYYKRSTNGGINWGADTRLTYDPASSMNPTAEISGSNVHIVWYDNRDGNNEIYYKFSTDGGVSWSADARLTNDPAESIRPSIAISNSVLHVSWPDFRDGNYEIYYKRNPTGNPTGMVSINTEIPKEYKLMQNYPNPFNPVTKINFDIAKAGFVSLIVYDALGREIETLVYEVQSAGSYSAEFNGSNLSGGVYFCRMQSDGFSDVKKLVLLK